MTTAFPTSKWIVNTTSTRPFLHSVPAIDSLQIGSVDGVTDSINQSRIGGVEAQSHSTSVDLEEGGLQAPESRVEVGHDHLRQQLREANGERKGLAADRVARSINACDGDAATHWRTSNAVFIRENDPEVELGEIEGKNGAVVVLAGHRRAALLDRVHVSRAKSGSVWWRVGDDAGRSSCAESNIDEGHAIPEDVVVKIDRCSGYEWNGVGVVVELYKRFSTRHQSMYQRVPTRADWVSFL